MNFEPGMYAEHRDGRGEHVKVVATKVNHYGNQECLVRNGHGEQDRIMATELRPALRDTTLNREE